MVEENEYRFRSPEVLARWLRCLILAVIAAEVVYLAALVGQYNLLGRMGRGEFSTREEMIAAATTNDNVARFLAIAVLAILVVKILTHFVWVYRTNANAHALGARELSQEPAEAIVLYLIPFVNFVAPPRNLSEVWRASIDPLGWEKVRGPWLVPLWWSCQIVANIIFGILIFTTVGGKTIPELQSHTAILGLTYLAFICIEAMQFWVVTLISRLQAQCVPAS